MEKNVKKIGMTAAGVIVLLVAITWMANRSSTIDITDYVEVQYQGFSGYATASVKWDEKGFVEAIGEVMDADDVTGFYDAVKNDDIENVEKALDDDDIDAEALVEMVHGICDNATLDHDSDLKNGDRIAINLTYDNKEADRFGIRFQGKKKKIQVSEIAELETLNPFDYVELEFEGISPNVEVSVIQKISDKTVVDFLEFDYEDNAYYKSGDKITVTAKTELNAQELRDTYGTVLSETSREYQVVGVDSYIFDVTDWKKSSLFSDMQAKTETVLKDFFDAEKNTISQSDLQYEGYFFLTEKDLETYPPDGDYNKCYMIYSATITSTDKNNSFEPTKVYFPVVFKNIIRCANGEMTVDRDVYNMVGGISLGSKWINGYTEPDSMKHALVTMEDEWYECAYGNGIGIGD